LDLVFFSNGILGHKRKEPGNEVDSGGETQNQKYFTNTNFYQSQLTQLFKRIFIGWRLNFNPLSRIAPYFIILLCSTPDNFILQGEIMLGLNG
jgi:hypothetical protein